MTVFFLSAAATISGFTIQSGDTLSIGSFAVASATLVEAGGTILGGPHGSAVNTTLDGSALISGTALSTHVANGGSLTIANTGSASGTVVESGGVAYVSRFDVNAVISNGGVEIAVGTIAQLTGTTVSSGGQLFVNVSAGASGTTIDDGGFDIVSSGGRASDVSVQSGGTLIGLPGTANAIDTVTVAPGGRYIDSGVLVRSLQTPVIAYASSSLDSTTVSTGQTLNVYSGAVTSAIVVDGTAVVAGTATSTTVNAGGSVLVRNGGLTVSTTLDSGTEFLISKGQASGSIIESSGVQSVGIFATATDTLVQDGGTEIVDIGADTVRPVVDSGGLELVDADGEALRATVSAGGTLEIGIDGSATLTTVESGGLMVVSFGQTTSTTVSSGGSMVAFSSQSTVTAAPGALVVSNGVVIIQPGSGIVAHGSPELVGGVVGSGGEELILTGGTAVSSLIESGGVATAFEGTIASSTVDGGGFLELANGTSIATTLEAGAVAVADYANASGTVIDGGTFIVSAGAAYDTTINNGGTLVVLAPVFHVSGMASGVVVNDGGVLDVEYGIVSGATVESGGVIDIEGGQGVYSTTVSSGGTVSVTAGTAGDITFHGGAESLGSGGDTAPRLLVTASGLSALSVDSAGAVRSVIVGSGGLEYVSAFGSTSNTTIATSGTVALLAGALVSSGLTFAGTDAALIVHGNVAPDTPISGFATTDTIDFADIAATSTGSQTLNPATDQLVITEGGTTITLQFAGDYTGEFFHFGSDGTSGTLITVDGTPCYCRFTLIETDRGAVPVESLQVGDRLITKSGETRPIRWIGTRRYSAAVAEANRAVLPIQFRAGSLADGIPRRDLFVSPEHAMFLDGVLVPALALVNGVSVLQPPARGEIDYFHLELETHDVILAEGALSESFIDDDSRGMFHNAAEYRALYPDASITPARFCAPRVESGDHLAAIHGAIAARAGLAAGQGGQLRGMLDLVGLSRIEGWAANESHATPVDLRVTDNGVTIGQICADHPRPDLEAAGVGDGRHGFVFAVPGGLAPDRPHVIRVQRATDGQDLPGSPYHLQPQGITPAPAADRPALRACLEIATRDRIAGWAWDKARPDEPVALQILDNGAIIGRVLANAHRADLAAAGIGDGRHAFDWRFPAALSLYARHVLSVRLEDDGSEAENAPAVIDPATGFDNALEQAVAQAIAAIDGLGEQERVLSFLAAQAERLLQLRADAEGQRQARLTQKQRRRWDPAPAPPRPPCCGRWWSTT
jgi:autotransporter passenger strand-loop-strand repeat protein